jgi:hypothetical protein
MSEKKKKVGTENSKMRRKNVCKELIKNLSKYEAKLVLKTYKKKQKIHG